MKKCSRLNQETQIKHCLKLKTVLNNMSVDHDWKGQQGMDFITEGRSIMNYGLKHYSGFTKVPGSWILEAALWISSDQDQPCCSPWEPVVSLILLDPSAPHHTSLAFCLVGQAVEERECFQSLDIFMRMWWTTFDLWKIHVWVEFWAAEQMVLIFKPKIQPVAI